MSTLRRSAAKAVVCALFLLSAAVMMAQPLPAPAPSGPPNVFYGAVPPGSSNAPVVLFIHGFRGYAADFWEDNDMYALAYRAGYRTAFVSLSPDNSRNDDTITNNAERLKTLIPLVAARYNTAQLYVVTHSKGGLDLTQAMLDMNVAKLIRAVIAIACPCNGTPLADWAAGPGRSIAESLGIYGPALLDLTTARVAQLRAQADPLFGSLGITWYTIAGNRFQGNVLTAVTGLILAGLTPQGEGNDGFVPVSSTKLPTSYAVDTGLVLYNHFDNKRGVAVFPKISATLQGLEITLNEYRKVANDGFGDPYNTWAWSMAWFKGKLYLGTGRQILCLSLLTSDIQNNTAVYPLAVGAKECPAGGDLWKNLGAEIWQYTPETKTWLRVFQSPQTLPLVSAAGVGYMARDVGFRGMYVYKEADGTEALYVGGVTAGSIYEVFPPYNSQSFPPPRLLRSTDGVNWNAVPQTPGTFFGSVGAPLPGSTRRLRSIRGIQQLGNRMFVTLGDFRGVGALLVSSNPSAGDNAWALASPPPEEFPIWNVQTWNNALYITTGDKALPNNPGYQVFKTTATGNPPFTFTPIIVQGGYAPANWRAPNGLSFGVFKNRLYVGTDRPTELARINPDDTWDLIVGYPRQTPRGFKWPLSGMLNGFGNFFTGHFWRMAATDQQMLLGTWDWSVGLRYIPLTDAVFRPQNGFDLYRTEDGIKWTAITRSGMNDFNYGARSMTDSPFGFFVGSATPGRGFQVYQEKGFNDLNKDGVIDQLDVNLIVQARGQTATGPNDPRDLDRNGIIDVNDSRKLITQCTNPGCAIVAQPPQPPPAPRNLESVPASLSGGQVILSWQPSPGAVRYRVFRMENRAILDFLPPDLILSLPGVGPIRIPEDILAGKLDFLCVPDPSNLACTLINAVKGLDTSGKLGVSFPMPIVPVGVTTATTWQETPRNAFQSIYFVRAEDASERLSDPSNIVGGPSYAPVPTTTQLRTTVASLSERGEIASDVAADLNGALDRADAAPDAQTAANELLMTLDVLNKWSGSPQLTSEAAADVEENASRLARYLQLAGEGKLDGASAAAMKSPVTSQTR